MRENVALRLFLSFSTFFLAITALRLDAQQPAERDRTGNAVSVLLNGAKTAMTIEFRSKGEWQELKLEPGKDARIAGDRIRVATTREDKAIVTVDMPIEAGKKYRLVWNAQTGMWDFSSVS
jgi:hypothetical protein